jgi:hypothetical protein
MKLNPKHKVVTVLLLSALSVPALADDRTDYNERVAARLVALFQSLDRNGDDVVTREESRGDLDLGPRFADMDINSDGNVTRKELQRYNEQPYGVRLGPR